MRKVLLDNLSIFRSVYNNKNINKNDTHFQNLVYSLVLWDGIIGIYHEGPYWSLEYNAIDLYNKNEHIYEKISLYNLDIEYVKVYDVKYQLKAQLILDNLKMKTEGRIGNRIAIDAIRYILLGANLGVDILLSKERTEFIKLNFEKDMDFSRLDPINMIDKEIKEFYEEINRKVGKRIICFKAPLLIDYICREVVNFDEALKLIYTFRKNKHIVQYRNTLKKMEDSLNGGNYVEFNEYLSVIADIVNSICSSEIKTHSIDIGLNPIPSVATSFDFKIDSKRNKRLHMRFLQDIAKFGLTERIMKL